MEVKGDWRGLSHPVRRQIGAQMAAFLYGQDIKISKRQVFQSSCGSVFPPRMQIALGRNTSHHLPILQRTTPRHSNSVWMTMTSLTSAKTSQRLRKIGNGMYRRYPKVKSDRRHSRRTGTVSYHTLPSRGTWNSIRSFHGVMKHTNVNNGLAASGNFLQMIDERNAEVDSSQCSDFSMSSNGRHLK